MLRTRLNNSYIKRTVRPLYGWTQATPKSVFLDPGWDRSVAIYPGMVMTRTVGENVSLCGRVVAGVTNATAANHVPYGLSYGYVGGDGIDEPLDAGINVFAVWVMDRDAEFEILAPAFDTTQTWTDPSDGTERLIHASTQAGTEGKLVPFGGAGTMTTAPVARLLKVNSPTKITIGGLR